eukprot:4828867-Pyramimonas_sp.AAC.1
MGSRNALYVGCSCGVRAQGPSIVSSRSVLMLCIHAVLAHVFAQRPHIAYSQKRPMSIPGA